MALPAVEAFVSVLSCRVLRFKGGNDRRLPTDAGVLSVVLSALDLVSLFDWRIESVRESLENGV